MTNLNRYDPFDLYVEPLDNLFRGFLRPVRGEQNDMAPQIKLDVKEDDKAYTIHVEMPGVKKEDIHIMVEGNKVSLEAEVKRNGETRDGEKILRTERYYGKVSRSFTLGNEVDDAAAEANYNDGVLALKLPKKAASNAKRLEIK